MTARWKPNVTVAAIIEREGRFLLVEEHTPEGLRLNNPAGHLDPGESPTQACARETLEETAFQFTPQFLVGVYMSRLPQKISKVVTSPGVSGNDLLSGITYMRFSFCGTLGMFEACRTLDTGIVRTLWLTADEIRESTHLHRSPLLVRCVEDYVRGQRFPLDLIYTDPSVTNFSTGASHG